jgi:hypothetical protein
MHRWATTFNDGAQLQSWSRRTSGQLTRIQVYWFQTSKMHAENRVRERVATRKGQLSLSIGTAKRWKFELRRNRMGIPMKPIGIPI